MRVFFPITVNTVHGESFSDGVGLDLGEAVLSYGQLYLYYATSVYVLIGVSFGKTLTTCHGTCLTCSVTMPVTVTMSVPTVLFILIISFEDTCDCAMNDIQQPPLSLLLHEWFYHRDTDWAGVPQWACAIITVSCMPSINERSAGWFHRLAH